MIDDARCARESVARCLQCQAGLCIGALGRHGRALSKGGVLDQLWDLEEMDRSGETGGREAREEAGARGRGEDGD